MYNVPALDDRVFIASYSGGEEPVPSYTIFDFEGLRPGSAARAARCLEYDRIIEALKGQGCDVHVWEPKAWAMYKEAFFAGRLLRNNA